jgi:hypothetical protein
MYKTFLVQPDPRSLWVVPIHVINMADLVLMVIIEGAAATLEAEDISHFKLLNYQYVVDVL